MVGASPGSSVRGNSELAGKSGRAHLVGKSGTQMELVKKTKESCCPVSAGGTWGSCRPAGQTGQKKPRGKPEERETN